MDNRLDDIVRGTPGEYRLRPGLRLTCAQAQRLWDLDQTACEALLGALVDSKFLARTVDGLFIRGGRTPTNQEHSVGRA